MQKSCKRKESNTTPIWSIMWSTEVGQSAPMTWQTNLCKLPMGETPSLGVLCAKRGFRLPPITVISLELILQKWREEGEREFATNILKKFQRRGNLTKIKKRKGGFCKAKPTCSAFYSNEEKRKGVRVFLWIFVFVYIYILKTGKSNVGLRKCMAPIFHWSNLKIKPCKDQPGLLLRPVLVFKIFGFLIFFFKIRNTIFEQ